MNIGRRKFIKLLFISGGLLVFTPLMRKFTSLFSLAERKTSRPDKLRITDNKDTFIFKDKNGRGAILIVEK